MTIWRRWVFPILLTLALSAIAVSLVKVAFFDDSAEVAVTPGAEIADPVTVVERGDVTNQLTLQGTVARDGERTVQATGSGIVTAVKVKRGATVKKDQPIFTVKQEDPENPERPAKLVNVLAPAAGVLVSFDIVSGQVVEAGAEAGRVSPASFHLLATVDPVQLYRLLDAPDSGTVSINGGPKPFTCTALTTQVAEDGTTSVRCSIPREQVVFPGLPAELVIDVGTAKDVLVIPTTAVKGGSGSGVVWVDSGDGAEPEKREVKLGVNDGSLVEVIEGLEEGEAIRQFVPGSAAPVEENCWEEAPGEEICESGVSW